jgi:putative phosphoesterase
MRLAILSDIHDNVWTLAIALAYVRDCDALICCGDLCSPFVIDELASGFHRDIHIVFGNNDADQFRITNKTRIHTKVHLHGEFFEAELDGVRFAANHFDYLAKPIAQAGLHDVVCFGHNHVFEIARFGETQAINPGAIMGAKFTAYGRVDVPPTFVVFDTATREASGFQIEANQRVVSHRPAA